MKDCPQCGPHSAPDWHFARNSSWARKDGQYYFLIAGCPHFTAAFGKQSPIADADRAAFEARWDAEAEKIFERYTARWTEPQRVAYRAKIWPPPPPVIPTELFKRNQDEAPAF